MKKLEKFNKKQIQIANEAAIMAEDLVINSYKLSSVKYDIKTISNLSSEEIAYQSIAKAFAQVIKYEGQKKNTTLSSARFDYYKICLQDHMILSTIGQLPNIKLLPFTLYIIAHEMIHIVRFKKFLQQINASSEERFIEEKRVHKKTYEILKDVHIYGINDVLNFYQNWRNQNTQNC